MAFLLKPGLLQAAESAADVQKLMKADLKNNVGKKGVKFIAAKNASIGGKTVHLFIVTDNPAPLEVILKAKHPQAYRAKGTCDLEKDDNGKTRVTIRTSSGQMAPDSVVDLLPLAVAKDAGFVAKFEPKVNPNPTLKTTGIKHEGVRPWAQEEYKLEAVKTVIASMTPDKKIGSIYFENEGRIRTTHGHGPERSKHDGQTIIQFNIDQSLAEAAFETDHKNHKPPLNKLKRRERNDLWKTWLKAVLGKATPTSIPAWAKMVTTPGTAYDVSSGGPPGGMQLVEIFKGINGKVEGWHPSRGVAAKLVTDSQTIAVLHAAIKHIDGLYAQVNELKSTDPEIVKQREALLKLSQTSRANPSKSRLKALWADEAIAKLMKEKGWTQPSIAEMDKSVRTRKRIDQIYSSEYRETLKQDPLIQGRLKALAGLRNQAFYDFVKSRLPKSPLLDAMREPGKV